MHNSCSLARARYVRKTAERIHTYMRYLISSRKNFGRPSWRNSTRSRATSSGCTLPIPPPLCRLAPIALIAVLSLHILAILLTEMKCNNICYHVNYYYTRNAKVRNVSLNCRRISVSNCRFPSEEIRSPLGVEVQEREQDGGAKCISQQI